MRMHVVVRGRVQGVGFRWFVREEARKLGLAGWVKNREDGGVEVAAEGGGSAIESLRERLQSGPEAAAVTNIESLNYDLTELPAPFAIVR